MIGQILIDMGYVSAEGLQQALAEQHRRAACGERIRLGELVLEMGFVTSDQLARAVRRLETATKYMRPTARV